MGASIEWINVDSGDVGVLRIGSKFEKYGDDYEVSATVLRLPDGGIEVVGATSDSVRTLVRNFKTLKNQLIKDGFKYMTFKRKLPDGTFKTVELR
jgi:hypothetical protein